MTQEEKAKAYDEALKVANKYKDTHIMFPSIKDEIFPELRESEDEKIRKELKTLFLGWINGESSPLLAEPCNRYIAWLEKQAEHKKFRDSIQVGDKVTRNEDGVLVNLSQLKRVSKKDEQILANSAKTCKDTQKPGWSEEDQDDKKKQAIELGCNAMQYIVNFKGHSVDPYTIDFPEAIAILKSLRHQSHWKPTEEHLKAFQQLRFFGSKIGPSATLAALDDLYDNLKAL